MKKKIIVLSMSSLICLSSLVSCQLLENVKDKINENVGPCFYVNLLTDKNGKLEVEGGDKGIYEVGTTLKFITTPNEGYKLDKVVINNEIDITTSLTYTFESEDIYNVKATFKVNGNSEPSNPDDPIDPVDPVNPDDPVDPVDPSENGLICTINKEALSDLEITNVYLSETVNKTINGVNLNFIGSNFGFASNQYNSGLYSLGAMQLRKVSEAISSTNIIKVSKIEVDIVTTYSNSNGLVINVGEQVGTESIGTFSATTTMDNDKAVNKGTLTYSFDNAEGIISIKGAAYAMYATEFRIYGTNSNPAGEDDPVETKYATFNFVESEHGQIRIVNPTPDGKYPLGKAVSFTYEKEEGYTIDYVKIDNTDISNSLSFIPREEREYTVTCAFKEYTPAYFDYLHANKIQPSRGSQGSVDAYYEPCRGLKGQALKTALHNIIKGHTELSYSQLTNAFRKTDIDPANSSRMIFAYEGSVPNTYSYNREHTWAKSHGDFGESAPCGTDLFHMRPSDPSLNSDRGNLDFGVVKTHDSNTSVMGLSGSRSTWEGNYRGIAANPGSGISSNVFEPKDECKGDVARMIFYMAVRYEGDDGELDLEVTGNIPSRYYNFTSGAKGVHGNFIDLYNRAMSTVDPVSDVEMNRNNVTDVSYQHNRNPFIDHPEFVQMIYDSQYDGPGALE